MTHKPQVILLMGPTASGKTALSIDLAESLNAEIISVDSALVYRGMDIGTAKPSMDERRGVTHHLIDIIDPTENFSAGQFKDQALALVEDIHQRGKRAILTGGTMLYFHALLNGLADLPDADKKVRKELDSMAAEQGWHALHQELQSVDPVAAARIHPNDPQRIQRALEIYRVSGRSQTDWLTEQDQCPLPFEPIKVVVVPEDRAILHQKIEQRFDQMLDIGLIDEVRALYERGDLGSQLPSIRAVGYRQVWQYLNGELDFEQMREKAIVATRQLAKRQFTWLRKQNDAVRFTSESAGLTGQALTVIRASLRNHEQI